MIKKKFLKKLLIFILIILYSITLYSQNKSLDELLNLNIEELMNLEVVSATKTVQRIYDVPATVRVITSRQIADRGYITLDEALSDLPGFQFRNILGFNSYVFQRGVPSQNNLILVLVEGIQINELNSGGFYGGAQYNLSNVERIEVVYGPASALYGSNAISCIINIITKDPEDNKGLNVSALCGTFNTLNTDLSYGYYNEKSDFGFLFSGMFKQSKKADLAGEEGDNNWTENMENFEDDLSFDVKITYKNFTSGIIFQDKQASRTTNYRTINSLYLDKNTIWHIRFINGYLKHVYDKNEQWSLSSQLYYRNATVMDNTIGKIDTVQVGYFRPNYLMGFESTLDYSPLQNLNLVCGVVIEQEHLSKKFSYSYSDSPEQTPDAPSEPEMESNELQSIYLQAQYSFIKSLQLTTGVRFDNSSIYDQVLTPRVGMVYNRKHLTAKLLYMEAFRAPKPWDFNWGDGNPELEPERMNSLEAVLTYDFIENLRIEASIYRNNIYDILEKDINMNMWVNLGELETKGFELVLNYYSPKFIPYFNYTYNESQYDTGNKVPEIAKHSFNIGTQYSFTDKFKINVNGNYLGSRKNPHIIPVTGNDIVNPAFILNSVLTCSSFHNLNIQLIIKNILDTEYYHTSNRSNPDYLVSRYRQSQRTIMLKIGYRI